MNCNTWLLCGLLHPLWWLFQVSWAVKDAVWDIIGAMWAVTSSMWSVTASVWDNKKRKRRRKGGKVYPSIPGLEIKGNLVYETVYPTSETFLPGFQNSRKIF